MIRNTFLAVVFTIIIVAINLQSNVIHIPLLFIFLGAFTLGYIEPQKGWISALQLAVSIFVGFYICKIGGLTPTKYSVFEFTTYISPLPCLFGGFMGSYFSKTINQHDDRRGSKNR